MTGEELRERIAETLPYVNNRCARRVAAAIVEALGITREQADHLREWQRDSARVPFDDDALIFGRAADALTTLLDAAGTP